MQVLISRDRYCDVQQSAHRLWLRLNGCSRGLVLSQEGWSSCNVHVLLPPVIYVKGVFEMEHLERLPVPLGGGSLKS